MRMLPRPSQGRLVTHAVRVTPCRRSLRVTLGSLGVSWLASIACESSVAPDDPPVPDVSAVTTGAALSNLQGGRFQLPVPTAGSLPEITAVQAEALAIAWRVDFGPQIQATLSSDRGAPVDPTILHVCRRTLYAQSSYLPVAVDLFADPRARPIIRAFGPWWIVSLCAPNGDLHVVLGVSAYSTDLELRDGHVVTPPIGGQWFFAVGARVGTTRLPLAPEEAVLQAAHATNRRVVSVPRLLASANTIGPPQLAHWRFDLESPVEVTRPDATAPDLVAQLYVRRDLAVSVTRIRIAALVQPPVDSAFYNISDAIGQPAPDPPVYAPIYFTRDPATATRFDDVVAAPSSSFLKHRAPR